jgi:hypothetical protein
MNIDRHHSPKVDNNIPRLYTKKSNSVSNQHLVTLAITGFINLKLGVMLYV